MKQSPINLTRIGALVLKPMYKGTYFGIDEGYWEIMKEKFEVKDYFNNMKIVWNYDYN